MSRIKLLLLGLIVLIAGFLRIYNLGSVPAGFTPDEAAFGYNAWSLLKTGQDEWSTPFWQLPFTNLRSFGDYKLPLYSFLAVPSVAFLGMDEFSTRLPIALLGTISVLVLFVLVRQLFPHRKYFAAGVIAALLLAVSPWHLPMSRGAFEANLITFFIPLGICLYLSKKYFLSLIIFVLSLYTYHSPKLVTPLVIFGLVIFFRPRFNRPVQKIFRDALIVLLLAIPAIYSFFFAGARASDISIFNPGDNWATMANRRLELINSGTHPFVARLVSNKVFFIADAFRKNYFSYLTPKFLFIAGPGEATYGMLPGRGVMYFYQISFLLIFLLMSLAARKKQSYIFTFFLLIVSFLPAAMTRGAGFAANRAAFMVIPLVIMVAQGIGIVIHFARLRGLAVFTGLLVILVGLNYFFFYLEKSPAVSAKAMGYGMKEAVKVLVSIENEFPRVKISRSLSEPHIYYAFYSRLDPAVYQSASRDWLVFEQLGFRFLDQYDGYWIRDYRFGDLTFLEASASANIYVGRPEDFPPDIRPAKTIYYPYPDYSPAVYMSVRK